MNPDGLDLMATLRQSYPDCRTMGVSGSPTLAAVRQALSLGTQEIVLEPFEASELETRVNRVLKATKRNLKEALAL
jgi:YesN/AraC family two-component response regulator